MDIKVGTIFFDGESLMTRSQMLESGYSEEDLYRMESKPTKGMKLNEAKALCKKIETMSHISAKCGTTKNRKN